MSFAAHQGNTFLLLFELLSDTGASVCIKQIVSHRRMNADQANQL